MTYEFLVGLAGLVTVLVLMFLKIPLAFAYALVGGIGCFILLGYEPMLSLFATTPYAWISEYQFTCMPMFILMGYIVAEMDIVHDLYNAAYKWIGRLPGGLAMTTCVVTGLFGAVCGSSLAAASTISVACYPEMKKLKYHPSLSTGIIASGATLDIMIPPSGPMIVFGMISGVSVGKMFIAGFGPGILEILLYCVAIFVWVKLKPSHAPLARDQFSIMEKLKASKSIMPIVIIFLLVFGGMYGGVFTTVEAGAVGVVSAAIVALAMRRFTWQKLQNVGLQTVKLTCRIFFVIVACMVFNKFIAISGLSAALSEAVVNMGLSQIGFLLVVMFLYILLGTFMDEISLMLLTLPFFLPVASVLGIDLVWFGICVIVAWQTGGLSPPVGILAFITQSTVKDVSVGTVFKGCAPFLLMLAITEAIVIMAPDIALLPLRFMK